VLGAAENTVVNLGHGRIKKRTTQVSEDASDCPDWLRIAVMRGGGVRREAVCTKDVRQRKAEQVDSETSLPPHKGAPRACSRRCVATGVRSRTGCAGCATLWLGKVPAGSARGSAVGGGGAHQYDPDESVLGRCERIEAHNPGISNAEARVP